MNEYISKDKALYFMNHNDKVVHYLSRTAENMVDRTTQALCQVISELPAADVQPVKHGEWKYYKNTGIFDIHKCSVCATPFELPMDIVPSSVFCFCPHCGARMDGDSE